MSFRNRCTLAGPNGSINLSIPLVEGRGQKRMIREVRISTGEKWQARHWKTITACYNRSPWFEFYHDELAALYVEQVEFLVDWNLKCLNWAMAKLAVRTPVSLTEAFHPKYDPSRYLDHRNHWMPATINRLHPDPPRYAQVFEDRLGFIPNLSILDRLFCQGSSLQ